MDVITTFAQRVTRGIVIGNTGRPPRTPSTRAAIERNGYMGRVAGKCYPCRMDRTGPDVSFTCISFTSEHGRTEILMPVAKEQYDFQSK